MIDDGPDGAKGGAKGGATEAATEAATEGATEAATGAIGADGLRTGGLGTGDLGTGDLRAGGRDEAGAALDALLARGKPGIARALVDIERAPQSDAAVALLDAAWARAAAAEGGGVVGLTGPPGVGKSSLIDALIRAQRGAGGSIAVIAVDPSSRRTGGALLGDRTRLSTDPADAGVFVRSMAARERLGGLAALAYPTAVLLRAAYDLVIVETVGVGQSETDASEIADATVFCAQPASGDALQFMKAGVMETPDLVLVTKADLGASARRAAADAAGALSLAATDRPAPPVLLVSAARGEGVEAALEAMLARAGARAPDRAIAQAQAFISQALTARFGLEGARAARGAADAVALGVPPRPFAAMRALSEGLSAALRDGLSRLDPPLDAR